MSILTDKQLKIILPQVLGSNQADGFAGHFAAASGCDFHLNHHVLAKSSQRYRVSTVGAYLPPSAKDRTYIEVGLGRMYETAVFEENKQGDVENWSSIEMIGCPDSITATAKHYELIKQYEQIEAT